jgi:hypothetical protein
MRSLRLAKPALALLVSVAAIVAVHGAAASPPTDLAPLGPTLPSCTASAPDVSGAHVCWVIPIRPGWQASTGEWIVVRIGDLEPTQSLCEQMQASVVATLTLDGQSLPVDTIPCHGSDANGWFVDWRALSPPLPPGEHPFSASWYFTATVDGIGTAGQTAVFPTQTLTVIPQG